MTIDKKYLSGTCLFGNDFDSIQIKEWFEDEREGYANLGAKNRSAYEYGYHQLNQILGYAYLDNKNLDVLAFGAAYGDELLPIRERIKRAVILDSYEKFTIDDSPINSIKWEIPNTDGSLNFKDDSFDLVTCFGVLHHIPNVEFVLCEINRVLKKGGMLLLREPIVSMGDWSNVRPGLSKRERGIPVKLLIQFAKINGFEFINTKYCIFSPLGQLLGKMGYSKNIYNSKLLTKIDLTLSSLFSFNAKKYHRTSFINKMAPSSLFLVLKK